MKKLHLILKGQWFDMIDSGVKLEEYRDLIPHWEKRLISKIASDIYDLHGGDRSGAKFYQFDAVEFQLGYQTDAKRMMFELAPDAISFGTGNPDWGAIPGKEYFVIKLGKRL